MRKWGAAASEVQVCVYTKILSQLCRLRVEYITIVVVWHLEGTCLNEEEGSDIWLGPKSVMDLGVGRVAGLLFLIPEEKTTGAERF